MRLTGVLETLGVVFATVASAQQYAGDVIQTSLRNVPGAEVAYFKIPGVMDSNKKKAANLTLINYYSHGKDGKRLVESKVQRAIIIIHGLNRDPDTYQSNMMSALDQVTGDPNINRDSVAIMSPYFANGDDKRTGYPWTDGLSPGRGSTTSALVWKSSQWSAGGNNQYPYYSQTTSSYTVLDTLVKYFDDKTLFPNMKQIVVAGHSLGGQTVQRYAAIGQPLNTNSPVTYWIGNPNSYVWLSTDRPLSTASCPTYDYYRDGYTNFTEYPMTYGQSLVSQGRSAILANYQSKQIAYARGTQDLGDDSSGCAPFTAGGDRNERFFNFIKAFPPSCNDPSGRNCDTVDLVNMGHDGGGMMAAAAGRARLFTDNFYGDGNRSYDFGYPRQQLGDDPFPDPSLNTTASSINNNTYAGNLTYAGCWFDSADFRSLDKQAYQSNTNTIELCTSTCVSQGFSIAGLEYGSQCYCGNVLNSRATKVVESSCGTPCSGNSSQTCGSGNRLSVFSNGTPKVLSPPTTPETIGNFYYSNCYTDTSPRTLSGKTISGSFMSLDYCANFCSGFKYFGTEYSSECYCGNYIESTAQIASSSDCSKTCANNTAQICGAGNRITLYENPDAAESSASTTATSSAPGSTSTSGTANGPTCPDSNGAIVTSNGLNFTIECGIDHQGGDLSNTYVSNFQQCIDACSSNSKCVDVSLSGSACYLKSTLGSAVTASYVWGAKLMVGGASSTVSSTTVSATGSSSSQSSSAVTSSSASSQVPSSATSATSSGATSTPSNIACPASNGNTYVGASGRSFTVECGIDHQGGDMGMKYVDTFQQCIDACDQTTGCVDVSLSGAACYMKSSVGAAANAPAILGAKLIASSSSSVATSTSTSASISTSASSTSVSVTSSQTSSGTSSSASATSTVTSCPSSDGSLVTLPSGNQYLIECGIDHQGGDLTSKSVASFADCIAACDSTPNCVDVSLSGDMCYMKNSVGPAINLSYIMGAKLMPASSSSSSSASSASATSDSSSSTVSSQSSGSTSVTSSASDSSSSASSTSDSLSGTSSSQSSATSATDSATVSSATPSGSSATSDSSTVSSSSTLSSSSASSDSATSSSSTQSSSSVASDSQSATTSASSTQSSSTDTSSSQSSSTQSSSSSVSASTTSDSSSSMSSTQSSSAQVSPTDSSSTQSSSSSASASATSDSAASSSQSLTSSSQTSSSQSSSSAVSTSQSASPTSSSSVSVSATAPSGTSSSASASASAATLPTGFSYAGCFVDSSSARALPVSIGASSTQTQQQCAMSCQAKGYKYSGTEYANECWCGNSIPSNQAAESQCSMACKGDSTQKCGAGARLSVVSDDSWKQTFFARQSFDSWNLMGCYTDSTAKRSLPNSVSLSAFGGGANATVSNCLMACQKAGFTYCGEEYYAECYGSKSAPTTSLASGSDPLSAGCNYPCKGNSSESCGGSGRIIIYTTNLS